MATVINQIDYSERDVGKMNPESKREVAMRFSINGKEYDLLLVWSFSSGKQSIFVNGVEEVFTRNSGASLIDTKFQFDGSNFHLIGTRTSPKGESYDYKCFELLIDGILLSDCPREGSAHVPPSTQGNSILDLLYPDHSCRKRKPLPVSEPKGHMYSGVQQQQPRTPVDVSAMSTPLDRPVTNSTPDLLLDFNPVASVPTNHTTAPSSDLLVPTVPSTYNNYNMFSQPQTDASYAYGGQMQVAQTFGSVAPTSDAANLFGGQMTMTNTYSPSPTDASDASTPFGGQMTVANSYGPPPTSTNDTSNLFGGQMTMANSYGPPPTASNDASNLFGGQMTVANSYGPPPTTANDASNLFGASPTMQASTNHYSYNVQPQQTADAMNPFESGQPSMQPVANYNNNFNGYDAQTQSNAFGGVQQPPNSPLSGFNTDAYTAANPFESSTANNSASADPFSQFGAPPAPYNTMQTTDTNPYGGY